MSKFSKTVIIFIMNIIIQLSEYGGVIGNSAHADQDKYNFSKLRLGGYGTISNTFDDRNDMMLFRDVSRTPLKSMKDLETNSTWQMDSRLGLQADYQFSPKVEAVIQGVLRAHADPTFTNSIELAYFGFRPLSQLSVRTGRVGYDAFLMSDIRNTGYAYLWVRPPTEFYGWVPIFSVNGADAAYNIDQGDVQWRIKAQSGKSDFGVVMGKDIHDFEADDLWALTLTRQSGDFKLKAGYSQFTSLNEVKLFESLHQGFEVVATAADNLSFYDIKNEALYLRNEISFKDNDVSYMTIGAYYDDGTLIAQAEIGLSTATGDVLPNGDMGYLSIGYRIGDFTPYSTFSSIDPGTDLHKPLSNWHDIQDALSKDKDFESNFGNAEALHNQAIYIINSTRMEQYTHSLGLRWDFSNQAALKLQWDNTHLRTYGYGLWWREFETVTRESTVNLYSFSMEFIF